MNAKIKFVVLGIIALLIVLPASIVIAAFHTSVDIQSHGTIQKGNNTISTVQGTTILRGLTLSLVDPNQNLTQYVANYVGNYTFTTQMIVCLSDLQFDGILAFPTQFNSTDGHWGYINGYPGGIYWTWDQLTTLINAFHVHGWQVWWSGTGIAWDGADIYNYITNDHPELSFTDANGLRANDIDKTVGYQNLIPNFWANYTSPDTTLGIANNTRLIDVICTKLGSMIDAGMHFDGFMLTDGWNGFNIQNYWFQYDTPSNVYYSFGPQEETEWAQDSISGYGLPAIGQPSDWDNWNNTQRASWITGNKTAATQWYYWWCHRMSQMYLQIKDTILAHSPTHTGSLTNMMGADGSSQWSSGNLGGGGLLNFTMIDNDKSIDVWAPDQEGTGETESPNYLKTTQYDAYAAALIKSKIPSAQVAIYLQGTAYPDNRSAVPELNLRQCYIGQSQNFIMYDDKQYKVANQTIFGMQYPPENIPNNGTGEGAINWSNPNWNNTAMHSLFKFIATVNQIFDDAKPIAFNTPIFTIPDGFTNSFAGNHVTAIWQDIYNPSLTVDNAFQSPVLLTVSEPFFNWELLLSQNGTYFIPAINMKDLEKGEPIDATLTFNAGMLNLSITTKYAVYWVSNPTQQYPLSEDTTVSVTVMDGSDVLIVTSAISDK